ncbi:SDR family oxidoreductase [Shouchella sp. JSM 1781072]|uniref:SDR family oxidoreductase n=1 Tax=Shouchella sp. JSM 1781072 TaxID=3344581 RepID=UPI0035BF9624
MNLHLHEKVVIVLAASKGLGRAVAEKFAEEGAQVVLASRRSDELKKVADDIAKRTGNPNLYTKTCDITKGEDIKQLVAFTVDMLGKVNVLVNNSGGPPAGGIEQFTDEDWQRAYELNLLSYVRAIREVVPHMQAQGGGHIANIASSSIKQTLESLLLSNTFRAGVAGLSKSLSQELAKDNILINTIGPGRIATDRLLELDDRKAEQLHQSREEVRMKEEQSIPLGRYGTPEEFANQLVFLCSGANTYVTGQALIVDGGLVKAL